MKTLLFIAFIVTNITAIAQTNTFPTSGNVGIGTTNPSEKLVVNGSALIGDNYVNSNTTKLLLRNVAGKTWAISSGANAISEDIFSIYNWTENSANPFFQINRNGNVGIGTIVPENKLHVVETSQSEFDGTNNAIPISNMVLDGSDDGRVVGKGPSLIFRMPANTDGSNSWAQARILASPDNTNNGDARGRLYLQVRDLYNPGVGGSWNWRTGLMISANGSVGIGTTTINNVQGWNRVVDEYAPGHAKLLVRTDNVITGIFSHDTWNGTAVGRIGTESPHDLRLMAGYGHEVMSLTISGNVGIGTTNPDEKLTVNGVIHAREVKVDLNVPLADFVFKPNYKLMSLPQVEKFVKANNHLPQMPSAEEVAKNGLSMGEMQNKLLQKVEELTLYVIEQQKTISMQQSQIRKLNNKFNNHNNHKKND